MIQTWPPEALDERRRRKRFLNKAINVEGLPLLGHTLQAR